MIYQERLYAPPCSFRFSGNILRHERLRSAVIRSHFTSSFKFLGDCGAEYAGAVSGDNGTDVVRLNDVSLGRGWVVALLQTKKLSANATLRLSIQLKERLSHE